jgi:hypothetical protein
MFCLFQLKFANPIIQKISTFKTFFVCILVIFKNFLRFLAENEINFPNRIKFKYIYLPSVGGVGG